MPCWPPPFLYCPPGSGTAWRQSPAAVSSVSWRANGLRTVIDFAVASHGRAVAVLIVAALLSFLPGQFCNSAGRSRRGAVRPGDQADDRDGRLCRHPVPGRRPLQEAGRHLLAAGRAGHCGRRARQAQRTDHDRALSPAVADRRNRRGAADLLGGARLRLAPRRRAGRIDDGERDAARRRGAARQDRRHAACDHPRGDGRDGASLSRRAPHQARACGMDLAGGVLDRARRRHPDQGAADPAVRRADHRGLAGRRPDLALAAAVAAAARHCLARAAGGCPGSSPS